MRFSRFRRMRIRRSRYGIRKISRPKTVIKFRPIKNQDIERNLNRMQNNAFLRAVSRLKAYAKRSGRSLQGIDDNISDKEAETFALQGWMDELKGLPLPESNSELDGWLSKAFKKVKKAVTKVAKVVRKVVKKVAVPALAAAATVFAGPLAGKAIGEVASVALQKYEARNEYAKEKDRVKREAQAQAAIQPQGTAKLPLGVTNAMAKEIVEGKIPAGMNNDQIWHIIEQAKLIAQYPNLSPLEIYIQHYHSLQMDAPPITYVENGVSKTFPGKPYPGKVTPQVTTPSPVPQSAILPTAGQQALPAHALASTESKTEAVEQTLSPQVTAQALENAKALLRQQGIDLESEAGKTALKLQIEQLQQQVAQAITSNRSLNYPPYTPPAAPTVIVQKNPDGSQAVAVQKEPFNPATLLLPAAGLFMLMKGS